MKHMHLLVLIVVGVLTMACSKTTPESSDSNGLQAEEQTMIDNQANKIDLLPQNMADYCDAVGRLEELPRLAKTDGGRGYALNKQATLRARLNEKAHDLLAKAAGEWLTQQNISKAFVDEISRVYGPEWEIVSSSSAAPSVETTGDDIQLEYQYQLSLRDKVFLGADKFMTKKGVLSVKATPDCGGRSRSGVRAVFKVRISD
ncbi:MAG TPA: hypothetical protein VK147_02815 [Candidatus Didemnitutus sp.]|nr:hypothetical protein [Candidatus Didemnitutus sp.]